MLVFELRSLASTAAQVDDVLPSDDPVWEEGDIIPPGGVHVTGRLSAAGVVGDRFYFSGHLSGEVVGECRRCLTEARASATEDAQLLFVEEGADDLVDDPDVFLYDPRSPGLDLRPAIREQWLLAAPKFVQCQPDCKGLCPTCGTDLNAGPCACEPVSDNRWAALRAARHD
jgi:uncharacterized protein